MNIHLLDIYIETIFLNINLMFLASFQLMIDDFGELIL